MRNFYRLAAGVDIVPLANALARQPSLWNKNRFRTEFPGTPHGDVDDIWLRFSDTDKCDTTTNVIGDDFPIWHPAATKLPQAKPIVLDLMRRVEAYELGRVLVTRLRPGGRILPHADTDGSYVNTEDRVRYHVVVAGEPGSMYRTGNETVCMRTGEVWWFNPMIEHEIINNSADDRIHLLVDMRIWP
jgi:Aspartyl/Asparaginyl beta-hydroxylase